MYKNLDAQALGISGQESEIIELALSHGFKGLTLDLVDFARQVESQGFERASRRITSARLKIGSFPLPVELDDEDQYSADMARLPKLLDIARQLGCTRAVAIVEPANDRRPYHENFEFQRRRYGEIAEVLSRAGMRLGLGLLAPMRCRGGRTYQFIQSFDEVLLLVRMIGAANVGVALDTWHWHLSGGTVDGLRSLSGDKIVAVSLADADVDTTAAAADLEARRVPGEGGAIDNAAVLALLAELGYDGPVTPSPDRSQFANPGREQIVKQAGTALEAVWKAAGLNKAGRLATVSGR
jgi:sugar phosphate isomerase/epimerase